MSSITFNLHNSLADEHIRFISWPYVRDSPFHLFLNARRNNTTVTTHSNELQCK